MLAKLTRGNQITIPKGIVQRAGLRTGEDYLDVHYENGLIFLKPVDVEERIPPEAYEKFLAKVTSIQADDIVLDQKKAEVFLRKRSKRAPYRKGH
jgi:bifunctional DNA-binding transcriptional regulator/antitoxin component of YhaV-PrlF toxin-antitoxin module